MPPHEAQAALQALFGDHLNPSELLAGMGVSVQALHSLGGVAPAYDQQRLPGGGGGSLRRPASAAVGRCSPPAPHRPHSAMPASAAALAAQRAAATVAGATAATALGELGGLGGSGAQQQQQQQGAAPLASEALERYGSAGLSKRVKGGHFMRTTRAQEIAGLRVVADGKVIPPASAPLAKIRPSQGADAFYEPPPDTVMGHHPRTPAWQLPPNHVALSKQWVSAAALAFI